LLCGRPLLEAQGEKMLLTGVKKEKDWLRSQWRLTYPTGWNNICRGISTVYEYYETPEILYSKFPAPEGELLNIKAKEDILNIEEGSFLTIRGISKIIKMPLMMTIFNQTPIVNVSVPALHKEFKKADYEKFNKSLCTYMDSIELYMHGLGK
jgi:hypothetical protein